MTDPISQYGRSAKLVPPSRTAAEKSDKKSDAAGLASAAPAAGADEAQLSEAVRKVMAEPAFDQGKVDSIKQALRNGQYPLDSRRIAENFVAIEKMIKG
jgi:negative regulator of flagellin synthesis FlgM